MNIKKLKKAAYRILEENIDTMKIDEFHSDLCCCSTCELWIAMGEPSEQKIRSYCVRNKMFERFKWFTKCWWNYLLEKPLTWNKFICRMKGHPEGVWWVNSSGLEPNMHCKTCEDDLG